MDKKQCIQNFESELNEEVYLCPSIISIFDPFGTEVSKNALVATSASFDRAVSNVGVARTVLHFNCLDTTKPGQYSNMWHIHALASALRRLITSIYPEKNNRLRPLMHKQVQPRILIGFKINYH